MIPEGMTATSQNNRSAAGRSGPVEAAYRFSVTTRLDAKIRAACDGIDETPWIGIRYPPANP
jgi:hypothetical protein